MIKNQKKYKIKEIKINFLNIIDNKILLFLIIKRE